PAAGDTRSCTVLLVDDDALVAEGTAAMLQHLGHHVLVASAGADALGVLRRAGKIDVVITDHAMPGMTGVELARQIEQLRPGLRVTLATGYAEIARAREPGLPRLDKPYRIGKLAALLSSMLDGRGASGSPRSSGPTPPLRAAGE